MDRSFRPVHTGGDADLAFAVVVLASYFTTFSTLQTASSFDLLMMIALGMTYIAVGIYGYSLVAGKQKLGLQLLYFAIQMTLAGFIVHMGKGVSFNAMVLLPLAGHSVVLLPRNWRLLVNLFIVFVYVTATGLFTTGWEQVWSGLPLFLGGQIFIIIFTQMAVNEERARSEVEKLYNDLAEANQTLREYAMQAEELAITKERNRMAREIHDGLGHYLTTIFMHIQAARAVMKTDVAKAQESLVTAQNQTQEALIDVRRSVAALRDAPGGDLSLLEEIEKLVKSCENSGLSAEMKIIGSPRSLNPQSRWTVYRTVQEGVSNINKHAHATCLNITLDYSQSEKLRLVVQDDGIGAEKIDGGFGLVGMRERINLVSGDLAIVTAPGEGFKLEVKIPG